MLLQYHTPKNLELRQQVRGTNSFVFLFFFSVGALKVTVKYYCSNLLINVN